MISVNFQSRDFTQAKPTPNKLVFEVQRYKNKALGGPDTAEIKVTGDDLQLWEMLEFLRCPVYLTSEKGDYVWWGYVNAVEVIARNPYSDRPAKIRVGASLDTMFNKVAVAWEDIVVGEQSGSRQTTAWTSDAYSQSEYGIKEGLYSGESASDTALATQARDILLAQKKYPITTIDLNVQGSSEAYLRCRGWWETLNWRYCTVPVELALEYDVATYTDQNVGTVAVEQIAQGIRITGGDINLAQVSIYVRKVGAPTDDLTVAIWTNPDGVTPTALVQDGSTIAAADIATSYAWETSTFSPEVTLTNGTQYFIVVSRSGAMDDTNYYQVGIDAAAGYGAGNFVWYDGANWATQASDMVFRLYDNTLVATSNQALSIATNYGQFFAKVESTVSSGVTSESYRDGDGSALFEIEQLLQHGTTNNRRMLVKVDAGRLCTIYEEPDNSPTNYYRIFSDSRMEDVYGTPIRDEVATCGVYARMIDVIPPSVDTTLLGNVAVRFIETAEYDAIEKRLIYQARDELDPFTVGRSLDG